MPLVVVFHDLPIVASSLRGARDNLDVIEVDNVEEAVGALRDANQFVVTPIDVLRTAFAVGFLRGHSGQQITPAVNLRVR